MSKTVEHKRINQQLIEQLPGSKNELVERNMGLVSVIVCKFIKQRPQFKYLKDELTSAGYLALVDAVGRLKNAEYPSSYMGRAIYRAIIAAAHEDNCIKVNYSTQKRAFADGRKLNTPAKEASIDYTDNTLCYDNTSLTSLREDLEAICECDIDRQILKWREHGWTDQEIAGALDISQQKVSQRRGELYQKYLITK